MVVDATIRRMRNSSSQDDTENRAPIQPNESANKPPERRLDRFRRTTTKFVPQKPVDGHASEAVFEIYSAWKVNCVDTTPSTKHQSNLKTPGKAVAQTSDNQRINRGRMPSSLVSADLPLDDNFAAWQASKLNFRGNQKRNNTSKEDRSSQRKRSPSKTTPRKGTRDSTRRQSLPSHHRTDNPTSEKKQERRMSSSKLTPTRQFTSEKVNPLKLRSPLSTSKCILPKCSVPNGKSETSMATRSISEKIARLYVPVSRKKADHQRVTSSPPSPPRPTVSAVPVVPVETVLAKIPDIVSAMASTKLQEFTAATVIQSALRSSNARYSFSFVRNALLIQKTWRGMRPRLAFKPVRPSATIIAREWRAYAGRKSYKRHSNARRIQTAWRCHVPHVQYLQYMWTFRAATTIQKAWRSRKCSSDYAAAMNDILTTQRICRGYTHRKRFKLRSEERDEERLRLRSAVTIQRNVRGMISRKKCTAMRYTINLNTSATILQSCWRCHDTRNRFWYTLGSVIAIQAFTRAVVARLKYHHIIDSVLISQSVLRRWLAKQQYNRMVEANQRWKASIKIQAMLRMSAATMNYRKQIGARKIQTAWRRHVPRIKYLRYTETTCAATQIQTAWRSFSRYVDFLYTLRSALLVQRVVRGHLDRKLFAAKWEEREQDRAWFNLLNHSATEIQRLFRGSRGRSESRSLRRSRESKNAAIAIQSAWRGHTKQRKYWVTLGSVIQVQTLVRAMLDRNCYLNDLGCIIVSQCLARAWIARRRTKQMTLIRMLLSRAADELCEKQQATETLQRWYRLTMECRRHTEAVIKVQSFFRMVKAMVDREIMIELERRKRRKRRKKRTKSTFSSCDGDSVSMIGSQVVVEVDDESRGRPRERNVLQSSSSSGSSTVKEGSQKSFVLPKNRSSSSSRRSVRANSRRPERSSSSQASSRRGPHKVPVSLPRNNIPPKHLLPPSFRADERQSDHERPADVVCPRKNYLDDDSDAMSEMSGSTASTYLRRSFSEDSAVMCTIERQPNKLPVMPIAVKPKSKLAAKGMSHRRGPRSASREPSKGSNLRHNERARSRSVHHLKASRS